MIKRFQNHQGFTLIEVLVSIALIGIVAVSIMGLFTTSLQNNRASKEVVETAVYAKNIMEDLKKQLPDLLSLESDLAIIIDEFEDNYINSTIKINQKVGSNKLYIIEVEVPGVREGSVENFVSQIYVP